MGLFRRIKRGVQRAAQGVAGEAKYLAKNPGKLPGRIATGMVTMPFEAASRVVSSVAPKGTALGQAARWTGARAANTRRAAERNPAAGRPTFLEWLRAVFTAGGNKP